VASPSRVYAVTEQGSNAQRLVRAINKTQAVGYVARNKFTAKVASQDELIKAMQAGARIEEANPPIDEQGGQAT
jgi:hypothetical protein